MIRDLLASFAGVVAGWFAVRVADSALNLDEKAQRVGLWLQQAI